MQRYVSTELTHFAGRSEQSAQAKYEVLKNILESGSLIASPRDGSPNAGRGWFKKGNVPISSNQRYTTGLVCFCDIPVDDLAIHMRKYGQFGLALAKAYLVARGASPVNYIARASAAATDSLERRDNYFDKMVRFWEETHYSRSPEDMLSGILQGGHGVRVLSGEQEAQAVRALKEVQVFFELPSFIEHHVFCFMKFFDSDLPDDHPENYYMEREWRVIGNVSFELSAVKRIILPEAFGAQFRADFPSYAGSVHLVGAPLTDAS